MILLRVSPDPVVVILEWAPRTQQEEVSAGLLVLVKECPQRAANAATATPRAPAKPQRTLDSLITYGRTGAPETQEVTAKAAIVTSAATGHLTKLFTHAP
jgi:hypothetical protein